MRANEKLYEAVEEGKRILDSLNIEYGVIDNVIINSRAKNRLGQCSKNCVTGTYTIEISMALITNDVPYNVLLETVLHELLHAHKNRMCHTGEWKRCAERVNSVYGFNIKRTFNYKEHGLERPKVGYKYVVACASCGATAHYQRETKVVKTIKANPKTTLYECRKCGKHDFVVETC